MINRRNTIVLTLLTCKYLLKFRKNIFSHKLYFSIVSFEKMQVVHFVVVI